MRIRISAFAVIVPMIAASAMADERLTAEEMLAAYEKTVSRVVSYRINWEQKNWTRPATDERFKKNKDGYTGSEEVIVCNDQTRFRHSITRRSLISFDGEDPREYMSGNEYLIGTFLGQRRQLSAQWSPASGGVVEDLSLKDVSNDEIRNRSAIPLSFFGRIPSDYPQMLWQVMRAANTLTVLPDMESIGDDKTYVVKSRGRFGEHTVWLDPKIGYFPRRILIHRRSGDNRGELQLGVARTPPPSARPGSKRTTPAPRTLNEMIESWTNTSIEERDGNYVVTAFTRNYKTISDKGDEVEFRFEFRLRDVDFKSENWTESDFLPSAEIPNGTLVFFSDLSTKYIWKNGTVQPAK